MHAKDVHCKHEIRLGSQKKNEWLKKERGISFEQVIFHLSQGDVWKIADHPENRH